MLLSESIEGLVQSLTRHVARAKEMLAEEQQKAEALFNSPEWCPWTPQECARARDEQEKRLKHAKKNLAQAEKAQKCLKKRAQEIHR
jgi:hypothetical protein